MINIPARSPDLNPIENFFHLERKKLKFDAIEQNITKRTYKEFVERITNTISEGIPTETIDNLISSMPKILALVVQNKGIRVQKQRTHVLHVLYIYLLNLVRETLFVYAIIELA